MAAGSAEAIVRALAARDCEVTIPVSSITDETARVCITCKAVFDGSVVDYEAPSYPLITGPTDHDPECPWHQAVEWVASADT